MTSVCVGNKLFSTATPLRHAAQLLTAHALEHRTVLDIQHIPGKQNDLADRLSRQDDTAGMGLDLEKRVMVSIVELIKCFHNWLPNTDGNLQRP